MKVYVGIDNGTTGTIGVVGKGYTDFIETPRMRRRDFQKSREKYLYRLDWELFHIKIQAHIDRCKGSLAVVIERPFSNAKCWDASIAALRCWESQLQVLERLGVFEPILCSSGPWQKELLPGVKGEESLKLASKVLGLELFPEHAEIINKHKDADGILIAEWARRNSL